MSPIHQIYHVALTPEEYRFLYRLAPDGVQAAMASSLVVEYPEPLPPQRSVNGLRSRVREGSTETD